MMAILESVLLQTLQVTALVLVMMTAVDAVNVWTRGKLASILKRGRAWRQYVLASLIGAAPGCMGGFTNVSLYMHGMISFGALAGAMVAVSGDEAFVMLALFPKWAVLLFVLLFLLGAMTGWLVDLAVKRWNIPTCSDCGTPQFHPQQEGILHYMRDHIWGHIIRKHLWKTALWTFGALLVVEIGLMYGDLQSLTSERALLLLFVAALMGLIPESGPHMIFVTMFANGLVPFSVLFTSAVVQDGHGMLPLLSFTVKDAIKIKLFNISFGVVFGVILYALGF